MLLKENLISKPVNLSTISDYRSYWATHFYAILNCLCKHKGLEYSFMKLNGNPKSLAMMRRSLSNGFFHHIKQQMTNWGFQYYLVNFLNYQNGSKNIVENLIIEIERYYNVKFSDYLKNYKFYISGQDSELYLQLTSIKFDIFPKGRNLGQNEKNDILKFSDLCLLLTDEQGNKVGIFGEVEGLKGNYLKRSSYWKRKQETIVFGFGISQTYENDKIWLEYCNDKIIFIFGVKNFVVSDFFHVINIFQNLFCSYPDCQLLYKKLPEYEEFDFFLDLIIKFWDKPINNLLSTLELYIDPNDIIGDMKEKDISIITDIRS